MNLRWRLYELKEKLICWFVWHLPHRVVMWTGYRIGAKATQGKYGTTNVPSLTFMDAMGRWGESPTAQDGER
jgi:hypothetical protein